MRIAVIGDVGGHATPLRHELARLGAHPDGSLPEDLIVVQVGDLIHRGPDSAQVVELVDRYLRTQPTQWIQLIGNHEANYLQPAVFAWPETLSRKHVRIIDHWWRDGAVAVAVAIETTTHESFLITHAGVTAEFWASVLGGPPSAAEAAHRINDLAKTAADTVFRAGIFLHGTTAQNVGPLWADATTELVPGWADRHMPFSQIHGHSSISTWREDDVPGTAGIGIEALVTIDHAAKHEIVYLAGGRLIGVDPDHRDTPTTPWRAFEFTGTVTAR